jgi:hypothetical protein
LVRRRRPFTVSAARGKLVLRADIEPGTIC